MARYNRQFTDKIMQERLNEGRGQGTLSEYKPWIKKEEVASNGRSNRLFGNLAKREIQLLSDNEEDAFIIIENSKKTKDIWEQFPLLPREETQAIAASCNIEHPQDPFTNVDIVMTTDFLITIIENGIEREIARTVKPLEELADKRIIEKLEIERRYWANRNRDWKVIVDTRINRTLAQNINMVRNRFDIERTDEFSGISKMSISRIILEIEQALIGNVRIRDICDIYDEKFGLQYGSSLSIAITVTRNEIITALNKPEHFRLAIIEVDGDKTNPIYLKNPFRIEPDLSISSINYKLNELIKGADILG
jgi:hypothetical protein